jgi:hypothetical protein
MLVPSALQYYRTQDSPDDATERPGTHGTAARRCPAATVSRESKTASSGVVLSPPVLEKCGERVSTYRTTLVPKGTLSTECTVLYVV